MIIIKYIKYIPSRTFRVATDIEIWFR